MANPEEVHNTLKPIGVEIDSYMGKLSFPKCGVIKVFLLAFFLHDNVCVCIFFLPFSCSVMNIMKTDQPPQGCGGKTRQTVKSKGSNRTNKRITFFFD